MENTCHIIFPSSVKFKLITQFSGVILIRFVAWEFGMQNITEADPSPQHWKQIGQLGRIIQYRRRL